MGIEKRILFITVGTTAAREELGKIPQDYGRLERQLKDFAVQSRDRSAAELGAIVDRTFFSNVLEAHQEIWVQNIKDILDLQKTASAEMTSTWLLANHTESGLGGSFKPAQDRIVLLSSDTAIGCFCAHLNAALMHQHLVKPACECGTDFSSFSQPCCPTIYVEVVDGMEARRGLAKILPKLREICEIQSTGFDRVLFNITGGYKGAVPAITWLAGNIFKTGAAMFYQHEDIRNAMRIQFMENPKQEPKEESFRMANTVWP